MIVDQFEEVIRTGVSKAAESVAPIPTVVPGSEPIYQVASDAGQKTLWVVFVIMLVASGAFTVMSWNVPLVRSNSVGCRTTRQSRAVQRHV